MSYVKAYTARKQYQFQHFQKTKTFTSISLYKHFVESLYIYVSTLTLKTQRLAIESRFDIVELCIVDKTMIIIVSSLYSTAKGGLAQRICRYIYCVQI